MIKYESELMHHGIKGQKWGDKNGPPYPLDKKEHMQVISSSKKKKRVEAGKDAKEAKRMTRKEKKAWRVQRKQFKKNAKKLEMDKKKTKKFLRSQEKLHKKMEKQEKFNKKVEARLAKERLERENKFRKGNENVGKLTDAEIQERINRLNLESIYRQKLNEARGKQQVKKHDGLIKKALKESASVALTAAGTAALTYVGKSLAAKMLHPGENVMNEKNTNQFTSDLFKKSFLGGKK